MNPPKMALEDAWKTLGEDPGEVMSRISGLPTRQERIAAVEKALEDARKIAKKLSAVHHPDKNPGDQSSAARFKRVQEAVDTIAYHTEQIKKKNADLDGRIALDRDGFIEIK